MRNKIRIIGCGSLLYGDDSIGCVIARKLQQCELPPYIEILEAGTPGLKLLDLMKARETTIIIDAIITDREKVGSVHFLSTDNLKVDDKVILSSHDFTIPEVIELGKTVYPEKMPESIEVWGIEIKKNNIRGLELTSELKEKVPQILKQFTDRLKFITEEQREK
ncbi:MAG: hydrogenase maturation protease [Vulcanimicrobiota bacterium]